MCQTNKNVKIMKRKTDTNMLILKEFQREKEVSELQIINKKRNPFPNMTNKWVKKLVSRLLHKMMTKKGSFDVPVGNDKGILQALSKSLRAFKCRIKTKYFNLEGTIEQNMRMRPDTHDERVKQDQWKFFVNYWCSEEYSKEK